MSNAPPSGILFPAALLRIAALLPAFLILATGSAFCQGSGSLSGTIVDSTGKPVADAQVTLVLPDSSAEEGATTTSGTGAFVFAGIRPVFYNLTVEATGFSKRTLSNVKVDAGTETPLPPIKLDLDERGTIYFLYSPRPSPPSKAPVRISCDDQEISRLAPGYYSVLHTNSGRHRCRSEYQQEWSLFNVNPGEDVTMFVYSGKSNGKQYDRILVRIKGDIKVRTNRISGYRKDTIEDAILRLGYKRQPTDH